MPPKPNFVKSVHVAFREMGKYNILGTFLIYCLSSSSTGQIFKCDSSKNVESCKGVPFVGYNNQSVGYPNSPQHLQNLYKNWQQWPSLSSLPWKLGVLDFNLTSNLWLNLETRYIAHFAKIIAKMAPFIPLEVAETSFLLLKIRCAELKSAIRYPTWSRNMAHFLLHVPWKFSKRMALFM